MQNPSLTLPNDAETQSTTIQVAVTLNLDKQKYETFRRTFDIESQTEAFSNFINDLLDAMNGSNPELMADYLQGQNERLSKKEEA